MEAEASTLRHWTEKAHPALLAILRVLKENVRPDLRETTARPPTPHQAKSAFKRAITVVIDVVNWYLWPFDPGYHHPTPKPTDSVDTLIQQWAKLGRDIEACTHDYVAVQHIGLWFGPYGDGLPADSRPLVTLEAEARLYRYIEGLTRSYFKTQPRRREAVWRKLAHATLAWWGIVYGTWPGTENHWTIETLGWEETANLYDSFCVARCKPHSPEQVRKIVQRLIGLLRSNPSPPRKAAFRNYSSPPQPN